MFYPYVTISAAQARESDDLRHAMSLFSLFAFYFLGRAKNLGIWRTVAVHPPKRGTRRTHLEEPSDWDSRGMQTLNWDTASIKVLHILNTQSHSNNTHHSPPLFHTHTHLHTLNFLSSVTDRQTDGRTDTELYTSAAEGTLPLGLVTMLFLVLFVWGCAGNTKCFISAQHQRWEGAICWL